MSTATIEDQTPTPGTAEPAGGHQTRPGAGGLRRMKAVATGLFGLAAVIYLVTVATDGTNPDGLVGYVQAGAEAAMVGPWPTGSRSLPCSATHWACPSRTPHSSRPRRTRWAPRLGEFVGTHFLTDEVVREKVRGAEVTRRAGEWLADPEHAQRVTGEMRPRTAWPARRARRRADAHRDREGDHRAGGAHRGLARAGPSARPYRGRPRAFRDRRRLAERPHNWVAVNRQRSWRRRRSRRRAGRRGSWTIVTDRVHFELVRFAAAVRDDPRAPVRQAIDRLLAQLAEDLRTNPDTRARVEQAKIEVYRHPDVQAVGAHLGAASGCCSRPPTTPQPAADPRRRRPGQLGGHWPRTGSAASWTAGSPTPRWPWSATTRRLDQRHHRHGASLGRTAGRRADRARRRPRPAVHPHQRHRGRGAGRDRDPRPHPAADLNIARATRNRSACCG